MGPASAEVKQPHVDFELKQKIAWCPDEEIVISGISGRFPDTSTIEEFKQKLLDGVDFLSEDDRRYAAGAYGIPKRAGKIRDQDANRFDGTFFGINSKQVDQMDPRMRMLIEATHEALLDAGVNPLTVRGSRTGVFIAVSDQDALTYWTDSEEKVTGYGMLGCSSSMIANRLSFTFDFKGPSYAIDGSASSGLFAIQEAVTAIHTGICDNAIVGGANFFVPVSKTLQYHKMKLLAPDGIPKPFDDSANGTIRSEAIGVLYLQKDKSANRVYATILGSITNDDGYKKEGITNPSYQVQLNNIKQLLAKTNVKPDDIAYVEASAAGIKVGDIIEMNAFSEALCKHRKSPLLVGSVKSNIGDTEHASGICAVIKVILAMETGYIPPTLNYKIPNKNIPALLDFKMQVVDKLTPLKDGVIIVNSVGLSGVNVLVMLRNHQKSKTIIEENKKKTRLICISGRTNDHVANMLDKIANHRDDEEFLTLVNHLYSKNIPGYDFKGYAVLTDKILKDVQPVEEVAPPIWFVFAGMGSQWAGMAKDVLKIPICEKTIRKLDAFMSKYGYNLLEHLTTDDESTFDNILNSLCCITSIQIALVDLLFSIGIRPDGILGHSAGEVGCAYADGTLTAEEALLVSYFRGRSLLESDLSPGAMAAVGLTWEETLKRVPEGIYAACHNSADSVTISGPPDLLKTFVEQLKSEGIFAREVKSSGFAFHSKYVYKAAPLYKKYVDQVITNAKPRTKRWISACFPESDWHLEKAQFSSPDYHVTNLISPVLFEEGFKHIPENAVIIEIAPHHLMQSVLKRALGKKTTVLGLLKRQHQNNLEYLFSNIGKAYIAGINPNLNGLLSTTTQFPVSSGTPMINSMIEWNHLDVWTVPSFPELVRPKINVCNISVDLTTEEFKYINGHVVDGRIVLPGVGYIGIAWKTFAKMHGKHYEDFPVVFEDVQFMRATIIPENGIINFSVTFLPTSRQIEISEGATPIMRSFIRPAGDFKNETYDNYIVYPNRNETILMEDKNEVYKLLFLLGFYYEQPFLGIKKLCNQGKHSELEWNGSYVGFMDTMIQALFYKIKVLSLHLPMGFNKLTIDPFVHRDVISKLKPGTGICIQTCEEVDGLLAGGIEMRGLQFNLAPEKSFVQQPLYEQYSFVPYLSDTVQELSSIQALRLFTHLVIENNPDAYEINALEYGDNRDQNTLYSSDIMKFIESVPLQKLESNITLLKDKAEEIDPSFVQNGVVIKNTGFIRSSTSAQYHFIVAENVITDHELISHFVTNLLPGGFLMLQEVAGTSPNNFKKFDLQLISNIATKEYTFIFFRKPSNPTNKIYINIDESFTWLDKLKSALKSSAETGSKVLLIGEKNSTLGILGLVNCLKREPTSNSVQCVFVLDQSAPSFSENDIFYKDQLKYDLVINVYKDGKWGSYRHITIPSTKENKVITPYAYANTIQKGDITTAQWIQDAPNQFKEESRKNQKLCYVYYASLTENDVSYISLKGSKYVTERGLRDHDEFMGMEYSGRDTNGKRIMGLVADKAIATTVYVDDDFVWDVPDDWTLEQACSIPLSYTTAYYALFVRAKIQPGCSILIHEVSVPVAQAVLSICHKLGCKVYLTGLSVVLMYLKSLYLDLDDDDMTDMELIAPEYMVMQRTEGKGVDVIFNSNGDHNMRQNLKCLKTNGCFIDVTNPTIKKINFSNEDVLHRNITYITVYGEYLMTSEATKSERIHVAKLVQKGIEEEAVIPFMTTSFTQIDKAVRFVNEKNYIGKVCIEVKEEEMNEEVKLSPGSVLSLRRVYFDPTKSYIVVGGLGGFGIELCDQLVSRFAKNIVIVSRSGPKSGAQRKFVYDCKIRNVNLRLSNADCSTISGAEEVIKLASGLGKVAGIFNLAAVLKDSLFENLSPSDFEQVCKPKVQTTKNLDIVSRKLCPELEYFVTFSSVSCGRGNAGQTNYGMANSAMDRICEARFAKGYPALSIQWGSIGDVGMILQKMLLSNEAVVGGIVPQRLHSCLGTLDYFLQLKYPVLSTVVLADKLKSVVSNTQAGPVGVVANILGIKNIDNINRASTLVELGTDSLTNVEIKQTLERKFGIVISPQEVLQLTFDKLYELSQEV